jgi:hypothetical protein
MLMPSESLKFFALKPLYNGRFYPLIRLDHVKNEEGHFQAIQNNRRWKSPATYWWIRPFIAQQKHKESATG